MNSPDKLPANPPSKVHAKSPEGRERTISAIANHWLGEYTDGEKDQLIYDRLHDDLSTLTTLQLADILTGISSKLIGRCGEEVETDGN